MATYLDFVISYAERFHAIIPLGVGTYVNRNGEIVDAWKRPLIKGWQETPLRTGKQAKRFWDEHIYRYKEYPGIGLATGQINGGYVVLDFDRGHMDGVDGYETLLGWQRDTGKTLPDTWTVITGSGGYHFYYHTDKAMRCFNNRDLGVDLKADGGFVVVPPSLHKSGNKYQWEIPPKECECAELDETVMAFIEYCRPGNYQFNGQGSTQRGQGGEREMVLPEVIPDGGRHTALISLIGIMNRYGCLDEVIEAAVRAENNTKCVPPLTEFELQKEIFPAIYRWEKGVSKEAWQEKRQWLRQQRQDSALQETENKLQRLNEQLQKLML